MITGDIALVAPWVADKIKGEIDCQAALGQISDSEIIAGVVYDNWNGASVEATIAIAGVMTPAYLAAIFHYPFIHLGAKKIICQVVETNISSVNLLNKMGFQLEAQILDAHPEGSILLYTMSKENCRFIGERYVKKLQVA